MSNVKTITVTVLNETAQLLSHDAESMGMSLGEIIDRLVLELSPRDPSLAGQLMIEYIFLCAAKLTPAHFEEALAYLLKMLTAAATNPEERAKLIQLRLAYTPSTDIPL